MKSRFFACVTALATFGLVGNLPASDLSGKVGFALENGDVNGDMERDLSDGVYLLGHLFLGGPSPVPLALCGVDEPKVSNGDANGDDVLDISDGVRILSALFTGGPAPVDACGEGSGGARNANPRVIPLSARAHGKYYGEWSGTWWQWAYSFPADTNPVVDTTGEFAGLGQSGSVWLLAGTFGQVVERTVTLPEGKTLFFPIVNSLWVNTPEFGDDPWSDQQEAFARALIGQSIDGMTNLSCQVDGVEIKNIETYRCSTPADGEYMLTFPENNVWGIPAGTYGPSVDDGIYLMLAPLSAGHHTIHFTAANSAGTWALDATYHLTVGNP